MTHTTGAWRNTYLTRLTLSGGLLSPCFNPATGVYTMAAPNRVTSTTVRTTLSDTGASVAYAPALATVSHLIW